MSQAETNQTTTSESVIKFISPKIIAMSGVIVSFWREHKDFLDSDDGYDWDCAMRAALLAMGYDRAELRDFFDAAMELASASFGESALVDQPVPA